VRTKPDSGVRPAGPRHRAGPVLLRDETGVGHGPRAVSRQIGPAVDRPGAGADGG